MKCDPPKDGSLSEQFLERAGAVARMIVRERARRDVPVVADAEPGAVRRLLEDAAPESPVDWEETLREVERVVLPHLTRWDHPGFFAYFPANSSEASILAELLIAGLGQQGMLWSTSPACSELETRVMDWLARLLGLPEVFCAEPRGTEPGEPAGGGVIQGTASESVLAVAAAARDRALAPLPAEDRWRTRVAVYASAQTHSSIEKACKILGPQVVLRRVPTDEHLAMDPADLRDLIAADGSSGSASNDGAIVPALVVATIGTTGTCAVDPIEEIGTIAREAGIWAHADAAYMGAQFVLPAQRGHMRGIERFDTFNFNPHKWLLTSFDCSALWLAPGARRDLVGSMSVTPEYLRNKATDSGAVIDYRDWHIPLGRRFRALKLWFVMRSFGASGLRAYIQNHLDWAAELEETLREDGRFDLPLPRTSALVCLRLREGGDDATRALMERVNASGEAFLTHCVVPVAGADAYLIRIAVGGACTTQQDVQHVAELLRAHAG